MYQNPLADLVESRRQDILEQKILNIIGRSNMEKLIELEIFRGDIDDSLSHKKVSVNPKYIVFIEENDSHAFVHMSNDSILHTVESRNEILKLIGEGSTNQTYIG